MKKLKSPETKAELDEMYHNLQKKLPRLFNFLSLREYHRLERDIEIAYQNELKRLGEK